MREPDAPPLQLEAALVVNQGSGRAVERFERAQALLKANGWNISAVRVPRDPRELPREVRSLIDAGHRRIILGGGDGTISSALGCFVESDAVLVILPFGTANSFARGLGIPMDIDAAVEGLTRGRVERVDLGCVDGRYFATTLSLGLAVAVTEAMPARLKRRLGALSYPYVGARVLARHRPFLCRLDWRGGELRGPVLDLLVANQPYQAGLPVAPEAEVQDRQLFVRVVRGRSRWNLARMWWHAWRGRSHALPFVEEFKTGRLRIDAQPPQRVNADGELLQQTPIEVSVAPRALAVILPAAARAEETAPAVSRAARERAAPFQ